MATRYCSYACVIASRPLALLALIAWQSTAWAQTPDAYIKATNTGALDRFGFSVGISGDASGDYLVVGAKDEDSSSEGIDGDANNDDFSASGAAYVYVRNIGVWTFQAYLKASNTGTDDSFGSAVAISGNTIVVGAPREQSNATGVNGDQQNNFASNAGAVYVFVRTGNTWSQQAYLKASDTQAQARFGDAVDIDGDTIVIGASGGDGAKGAAYVFTRSGTTWTQQQKLTASNADFGDVFGNAVALDGDTIAVGAKGKDFYPEQPDPLPAPQVFPDSGAAYVFTRSGVVWTEQALIKSSNPDNPLADPGQFKAGQQFGWMLDLSGNTLAVGAPFEASGSTGIDGDQDNQDAVEAGAVYLYERSGGSWVQTAYVKASNTDAADQFGKAVALNGDTLAVGAVNEASEATGQGGNQLDNSKPFTGAVYVFERDGNGAWSQKYYDKPFTVVDGATVSGSAFGTSLDIYGEALAIGAIGDSSNATGVNKDGSDISLAIAGAAFVYQGLGFVPAFVINAGVNDAWVSADAPFQGFFFTVFDQLQLIFLSWFTFDTMAPGGQVAATFGAADQRWVTASGTIQGDTATLNVELTNGGIFNSDAQIAMQDTDYGTITIQFLSCTEAIVTYDIPSLGLSGQFTATRVLPSNVDLCMAMQ